MMIDFALEAERKEGRSPEEAIYQACLLRFRPIMMTTMAALLGAVPLAFGSGVGSELRKPLGISIIGGLIVSQVLTLFTTPVIYLWFGRIAAWVGHLRGARPRRRACVAGAAREAVLSDMSISTPFIQRPGGYDSADDRADAGGRDRLFSASPSPRCRRSIFPPSTSPPICRAPARGDGGVRSHSARKAVHPHRRRHRDDLPQHGGIRARSRCSSI